MRIHRLSLFALILVGLTSCAREVDPVYVREIDSWHQGRTERLASDTGWLTVVGLHPLHEGDNTVGSAPSNEVRLIAKAPPQVGIFSVSAEGIIFTVEPAARVLVSGHAGDEPVTTLQVNTDAQGESTILATGSLQFYVIDREGSLFVRVKDRESDVLRHFTGVDRFPVDDRWRVTARLVPHDPPRKVSVLNVLGQTSDASTPGTLVFELNGKACSLIPISEPGESLFIVFDDETNGKTTYGGGRFLYTEPPLADGTVILDFNKAINPPCAFTAYATCPIPPDGNSLPVSIEAGEKMWRQPH